MLQVTVGLFAFKAKMEEDAAPDTCAEFKKLLPFRNQVIHVRWSGEAVWIPLGDFKMNVGYENHTSHPSRGDILFYPGGISETEILLAYGSTCFASKMGQLAGNHFLTIVDAGQNLSELGRRVLWEGHQDIVFQSL
ncbi:hypothetical protein LCGC14_2590940, partial [marine sediment metagenome]